MSALAVWAVLSGQAFAQPSSEPQFHKIVNFQRGPQDPTDAVVLPDPPQTIMRTQHQVQSRNKVSDDDVSFIIRTDLPGPDRLFDARKSETMMREYIRRDAVRSGPDRVLFPEYPPISTEQYTGRQFARSTTKVEPGYVCHGRLYFEQPNFERAGWDLGYLTPGLNVGVFYYDLFMFPYHSWSNPCVHYDCNTGKCQPGDATPFYCYREKWSLSGAAAQTFFVGCGFFVFP